MTKKVKHIEQHLQAAMEIGHYDVLVPEAFENENGTSCDLVRVHTEIDGVTGCYSFAMEDNWQRNLELYRKNLERKINNRLNYGAEGGRSAVYRDNATAIQLGKLKNYINYKGWAPVLRCAYELAQQAPVSIRQYVYRNYLVALRKKDRAKWVKSDGFVDILDFDYYTAAVMPIAWYKGVEVKDFNGIKYQNVVKDLVPTITAKVGDRIVKKGRKYADRVHHLCYLPKNSREKYADTKNSPSVLFYAFDVYGREICRYDELERIEK